MFTQKRKLKKILHKKINHGTGAASAAKNSQPKTHPPVFFLNGERVLFYFNVLSPFTGQYPVFYNCQHLYCRSSSMDCRI
jgi:hypothetical protein